MFNWWKERNKSSKSNVLKFILENGAWFVIRPSGTEPKMKAYIATTEKT